MENEKERGFHWIYLLAICYVVAVYMAPILCWALSGNAETESQVSNYLLGLPILLGIINYIVVFSKKESIGRRRLLNCAVMIKYTMIPIYIMGGLLIAIFILLMFTPVVIMMFVGPTVAVILSVIGWLYMMGGAPYALAYISESKLQGIHGKLLCNIATVLQFFFTVDVLSLMVLALKEKRCVKSTIIMLAILLLGFLGCVVWLVVAIVG